MKKAANNSYRTNSRHVDDEQSLRVPDQPARTNRTRLESEASRSTMAHTENDDYTAEVRIPDDIYDVPLSPPARREPARELPNAPSQEQQVVNWTDLETGDGLFVEQEAHDPETDDADAQLYNDPTILGTPPPAQQTEEDQHLDDAAPERDLQSTAETEQIRRLVVDLGPAPPEPSAGSAGAHIDDRFIFDAPEGEDRLASAAIRSYSLKSITELMGGTGWTQSRVDTRVDMATKLEQLSKWSRPLWDQVYQLKRFWEEMPRAPQFGEQCDYLHSSSDEASGARLAIKKVDKIVREIAKKARKTSNGDESDMPPSRFVVDLYEKIIPLLVIALEAVFRKGTDLERSRYNGRFTKTTLQLMQRVVAWIEILYEAMQVNLARRRQKEQTFSKKLSREKLGEYLRGLKLEFRKTWKKTDQAIERQRTYEARLQEMRATQERERHEIEEARRRQRELCDRRLEEYTSRLAAERPQKEARSSRRTNRGTQRAMTVQSKEEGPSRPWREEDATRLLQILTARPKTDLQALAGEFERSEEDVAAIVALLKQSARTYAASRNKQVPAFATV